MKRHLSSLSVLHYVYGAFVCFAGLFLLVLVFVGHFMGSDWFLDHSSDAPPAWVGVFLSSLGWVLFALLETVGLLNIISGRNIDRRRNRTLSQVVAAIDCMNLPFGTALGVFTLIALGDEEVKHEYAVI